MKTENNKIPYDNAPIVRGGRPAPASSARSSSHEKPKQVLPKPSVFVCMFVMLFIANIIFGVMLISVYSREYIINQTINNNQYDISPSDNVNMNVAATKAVFSTVCVSAGTTKDGDNGDRYGDFFELRSRGAGVIMSDDKASGNAYIMTNYHVIKNESNYRILLYGSVVPIAATLIGSSQVNDTAVLKITNSTEYKISNSMPAEIASSANISQGDDCLVVGNPKSCDISVSKGVVSRVAELIGTEDSGIMRLIRVDAPINGGNSGGGLYDYRGRLIGIVNAKMNGTDIEGMGYAIPIDVAYNVARNLINNNGRLQVPVFGFDLAEVGSIATINPITGKSQITTDVEVDNISVNNDAFYAGLRNGDKVLGFSYNSVSVDVKNRFTIQEHMYKMCQGDTFSMRVIHKNEENSVTITYTLKQIKAVG